MKEITCRAQLISELERLPKDRFAVEQMKMELEEVKAEYAAIKATDYDKQPSGSGDNTQEEKMLTVIANKTKLEAWLKATQMHIDNLEHLLGTLQKDERDIIERTVINRKRNAEDEIAEDIGLEKRQIYNKKNTILHQLCKLKYGQGYNP